MKIALKNGLFKVEKRTKIKIADGITWVHQEKNTYDLIIVDLYLGDKNIARSRENPFLKEVKTCLKPGGIVLYSCHYTDGKRGEYNELVRRLKTLYKRAEVVFEFPKNKILLLGK